MSWFSTFSTICSYVEFGLGFICSYKMFNNRDDPKQHTRWFKNAIICYVFAVMFAVMGYYLT